MPHFNKELCIHSDTLEICEIDEFITEVFSHYELNSEYLHRVMLSVKEAVTNAIIHGNKMEREKLVRIKAHKCSKFLYFKIIDEGDGFDYASVKDPTLPENIMKMNGRGLHIIKNVCDSITFREKGNIIEFRINLDGKG